MAYNVKSRPLQTARKESIRFQDYTPPREAGYHRQTARKSGSIRQDYEKSEGPNNSPAGTLQTARKRSVPQDYEQRSTASGFQGVWIIDAPAISSEWSRLCASGLYMTLGFSDSTHHLWGRFEFGVYQGYLRSCGPAENKAGNTIAFLWRGRESGTGKSSYGPSNRGSLTLKPRGLLSGEVRMSGLGQVELNGRKVQAVRGTGIESGTGLWKRKFWELNEANYERENVSRWGGSIWGRSFGREKEENSDTDGEGHRRDDEDEDESGDESGDGYGDESVHESADEYGDRYEDESVHEYGDESVHEYGICTGMSMG